MRFPKRSLGVLPIIAALFLLSAAVSAHHSRAGYDQSQEKLTTRTGVVVEVQWRNPHVNVLWDTKDDNGTLNRWTGELSSTTTMLSEGMSRTTLKPGDPIAVTFMPASAGTSYGLIVKIVRPNGEVVINVSERRANDR